MGGLIQRRIASEDALRSFQEALEFFEQRSLATVEYSVALNHVFEILAYEHPAEGPKDFQKAEVFGRHGVYSRESLFGIDHPRVQVLRNRLAHFYMGCLQDVQRASRLVHNHPMEKPDVPYVF